MARKISKDRAKERLWRLGNLSWKLMGNQKEIYRHFTETDKDIEACLISRQYGKSFTLCLIAVEQCIKEPNSIIKYACPVQKMVERIIIPRIREIIADCPEDLKPEWKSQQKMWQFPNGSEIQVAGCNAGQFDNLRGGSSHLSIVDEAAFIDELDTVIFSVLAPTTDTTDGKIFLASTPNPDEPMHEFHENFVAPMEAEGTLLKFDYTTSPMIDEKKKERIIARYPGGVDNLKFRCEYLCEIPRSSDNNVIPEFHSRRDTIIVDEFDYPDHYDGYVAADIGFRDLTVVLFAYYDFKNAQLVFIDELVANGVAMTTDSLANDIKDKEKLRFYNEATSEQQAPYIRVSDNDLKLINDLNRLHNLQFMATAKDNKDAAVNQLRMWVSSGKIRIHKRCKHLIYHMENAQWDKSRKKFKHLKDSPNYTIRGGHADALDAAIYLVRNLNEGRNPFPDDYKQLKGPNIFQARESASDSPLQDLMNSIMGRKK